MRSILPALLLLPCWVSGQHAQDYVDSIFVEVYHVEEQENGPARVTYRLYVDLAEDVKLQMVFGDEENQLRISTTTHFFNTSEGGSVFGWKIPSATVGSGNLVLDSWLTIGAATDQHWGVPFALDTDGSVVQCPKRKSKERTSPGSEGIHGRSRICDRDGLVPADSIPPLVNFLFEPGYLKDIRGSSLHTMNGAWASLGGVNGTTHENIVLIGQFTTTGDLSYQLNLQVGLSDGSFMRLVHSDPVGPFELLDKRLERPVQP